MAIQKEGTAISIDELNKVLASLKEQREILRQEYNTNIRSVIENSNECISVSGLDINSILSAFSNTFNSLDQNFESLINVLENNVIQTYSELTSAIQRLFGADFADKLSSLLDLKN